MIGARGIAWGVVMASIALGMEREAVPARAPATDGAYTILTADFHVHSFPGDGGLAPWDITAEARRRGLDVVALTNHNNLYSWRLAQPLASRTEGVMVLPGIELTSIGYHMAAVAVETPVAWRQSPAAAAAAIHAQGGIAIAAHPASPARSRLDDPDALDALDGFEAASSDGTISGVAAFARRALTRRPSLAAIGASDFHYFAPLGVCRTFVFVTERSPAGVLEAVRRGRTVACDGRGDTSGPTELAAAVTAECRRLATAPAAGWGWIDGVSTCGAWLGLVALVALGARERSLA
jgi:hypothetical protein